MSIIEEEVFSFNEEIKTEEELIILIKIEDNQDNTKIDAIKSIIEDQTKLKTTVFVNENPTVIENKLKEADEKSMYVVNIEIRNDGISKATIQKAGPSSGEPETTHFKGVSQLIPKIKESIELIYDTNLKVENINEPKRILINIKTEGSFIDLKKGEFYGEFIQEVLEKKTGISTKYVVNNASIQSEVERVDGTVLINIDPDGKVSYDEKVEQAVGPKQKTINSITSIIEQQLDSLNDKESEEKRLIISIKSEDINDISKVDDLKTVLEDLTKIETYVLINESPIVIDNKIKEASDKTTYLVKIKLTDNGNSQAILYKNGSQVDNLENSSFQEKFNIIPNIKDSIELFYNTKVEVIEKSGTQTKRIIIHIKTNDDSESQKNGEFYGEIIERALETETGISTRVFVNNPSIQSEVDLIDGSILLNLELDGKLSYNKIVEIPLGTTKEEIDSIILILEEELDSLNEEELKEKQLIISITSEENKAVTKVEDLKSVLEDLTKIETFVFINESPIVIDNKIKESSEKTTYLVNIKLADNGDSQAVVYKDGIEINQVDKSNFQDNFNIIRNIKDSVEAIYNTKLDVLEGVDEDETKRIIIHITTSDDSEKRGKLYGKILEKTLEKETGINTDVFVNNPSIQSEVDRADASILFNLELDGKLSVGGNIDLEKDKVEQYFGANVNKIDSIRSIIEDKVESLNEKEQKGEALIISIRSKNIDDGTKIDDLKTLLEDLTKLEITVFINENPTVIGNIINGSDKITYVVNVELTNNEDSKAIVYKEGTPLNKLDAGSLDIIPQIKAALGEVYNTKLDITEDNSPEETFIIINIKTGKGSIEEAKGESFGKTIKKMLESKTGISTKVFINNPSIRSEVDSNHEGIFVTLELGEQISFDDKLVNTEYDSAKNAKEIDSIISVINDEVDSFNVKGDTEQLIVSIKGNNIDDNSKVVLKTLLEKQTGIQTTVLINRNPEFIQNMIKESNGKSTVINIELLENENSKASIYEEGVPLGALVGTDLKAVNDIISHVKESIETVYDTVLDIDADKKSKPRKIIISIKALDDQEQAEVFGENIKDVLQDKTGIITKVLVNKDFFPSEEENDIIFINLEVDDQISFDGNLVHTNHGIGVEGKEDLAIISIIEQEVESSNEKTKENNEETKSNNEQLIISIINRNYDENIKASDIKSALEAQTNIETIVFINERATIIENKIKENNGKIKYLVNIELFDEEDARATIYKKDTTLERLDGPSFDDSFEIISKIKETVETVYGTNLNIDQDVKANRIIINIKTTRKSNDKMHGESFSQIIQRNFENKTGIPTDVFVNNPSIETDVDNLDSVIMIELNVDGELSYDGKLSYTNQSIEQLSGIKKKEANSIISYLQEEILNFNQAFNENQDKKEKRGKASLILSIDLSRIKFPTAEEKSKVHRTVIEQLKIYIKENTGLKNFVLIDRPETFTKNLLNSLDNYYYIPVRVTRNNRIIQGQAVNKLRDSTIDEDDLDSLISGAVKEVLHWEYFSKEDTTKSNILNDSNILTLSTLRPTPKSSNEDIPEVTTKYYKTSQSYDRVIKILADLFIKTLDLSFRIKGAMDKNSKSGDNVEFQIVSRNEDNRKHDFVPGDGNDPEIFVIPEIIKITPFDAMFVHNNQSELEDTTDKNQKKKPVIIDIENDQNINFNVSNGMVFEIDLSNLPSDKIDREKEIRLRVRSFIDGIKVNEEDNPINIVEKIDNDSLSDAIIKNITQIVLIQMDEALKNKNDQFDWNLVKRPTTDNFFSITNQEETATIQPSSVNDLPNDESTQKIPISVTKGFSTSTPGSTTPNDEVVFNIPNPTIQQSTEADLKDFENETNKVINEVKNTISGIIKDVLSSQDKSNGTENNFLNIVQKIREKVPADVKIKTSQVDEKELQDKIKETVGKILTEEEIKSVVQLRNISRAENTVLMTVSSKSITDSDEEKSTVTIDLLDTSDSTLEQFPSKKPPTTLTTPFDTTTEALYTVIREVTNNEDNEPKSFDVNTEMFSEKNTTEEIDNEIKDVQYTSEKTSTIGEEQGLVINLKDFSDVAENRQEVDETRQEVDDIWRVILTASPKDNELIDTSEVFISPSPAQTNEAQNIIQDGNLFADTSNSGVVKAKVVEDTSFARSIRPPNVGIAAIISIVIGILALLCFTLMIFLAMARRRRQMEEMAPSTTAYTSTSRYTPEGTSSNISDMKATYIDELSPNVSSSDLQTQDVVIPMDGHQTIIGSYEDFLDVPTGARPNILQSLPISPTTYTENVPRTHEMTDPELAFTPRFKNYN